MKKLVIQTRTEKNLWVSNNGTHSYLSGDGEVLSGVVGPVFTVQPISLTKTVTDNASFSVDTTGAPTITYQWYFDSSKMINTSAISGVTSKTLSISPAFATSAGSYFAVASNGTDATSHIATLTLVPPTFGNGSGSREATIYSVTHFDGTRVAGQLRDYN
jgi:hypothetical protein